ncbi:galactokinase [Rhizophlyctis rosea]|nr:galactokinase [Rhizophlyctis rosea]
MYRMDQSISIMAPKGSPLIIHFYPELSADPITIPPPSNPGDQPIFVVANTLVTANKHVTAPIHYNLRAIECRLASLVLSKELDLEPSETLREVQEKWAVKEGLDVVKGRELEMLQAFGGVVMDTLVKEDGYTLEDIGGILGMSVEEIEEKVIRGVEVRAEGGVFQLFRRAKHVVTEAARVWSFKDVCGLKKGLFKGNLLRDLGDLMNASQTSCRDLFNCSCPELDELTTLCRQSGAFGSRLTGAGWGGCTVSLVPARSVSEFIQTLKTKYYAAKWPGRWDAEGNPTKEGDVSLEDCVFASEAGSGCAVLEGSGV